MKARAAQALMITCGALAVLTAAPADADAGADCGAVNGNPDSRFVNYDAAHTDCTAAWGILDGYFAARERAAHVGEWECGARGAAEADRTGIVIRCVGPRGPLHSLQVETP